MTLSTHVYLLSEANVHEVFHHCRKLLGCQTHHAFTDGEWYPKDSGRWWLSNKPGLGLPALLRVMYRPDGEPYCTPEQAAVHTEYCEPECDEAEHDTPCWFYVDFDTAYGYRDAQGGCGDLHARLVAQLGQWLDAKGIRWSWKNEYTGDIHGGADKYERLVDLCTGGSRAWEWMVGTVLPAVAAGIGREVPS